MVDYSESIEKLLKDNAEVAESMAILHRFSHSKFNFLSNMINVFTIIVSAGVGFTTGLNYKDFAEMNIVLGILSVVVGIAKSLDNFFSLARRSECHRLISVQYGLIFKRISVELALPAHQREDPQTMLMIIKSELKNLEESSPLIPASAIKKYNQRYPEQNVKKPNLVNGLSVVEIHREGVLNQIPRRDGVDVNVDVVQL